MVRHRNDNRLTVMALLKAKPGKEEDLKEAMLVQIHKIKEVHGYDTQFDVHQSKSDTSVFTLYEIWESEESMKLHFEQEYTKALVAKFEDLLAEPLQIWHLTKLLTDELPD